jgi:hypothetical protein
LQGDGAGGDGADKLGIRLSPSPLIDPAIHFPLPTSHFTLPTTKMSISDTLSTLKDIPSYISYFFKALKLKKDIQAAITEFPGIEDEEELFRWCVKNSDLLVNYSTYTTFTMIDDYIALQIRVIITNKWETIIKSLRVLKNAQINNETIKVICDSIVSNVSDQETQNPFLAISVVSIILNIVRIIQEARTAVTDETEVTPVPVKRPILAAIRKLLGRES